MAQPRGGEAVGHHDGEPAVAVAGGELAVVDVDLADVAEQPHLVLARREPAQQLGVDLDRLHCRVGAVQP